MTDRVGKIKAALSKVSGVAMLAVVALLATGQAGAAMPYDPIYQQQRSRPNADIAFRTTLFGR